MSFLQLSTDDVTSRLTSLLQDSITLICRNSVKYSRSLRVDGTLGITVDEDNVLLVSVRELLRHQSRAGSCDTSRDVYKARRKRRASSRSVSTEGSDDRDTGDDGEGGGPVKARRLDGSARNKDRRRKHDRHHGNRKWDEHSVKDGSNGGHSYRTDNHGKTGNHVNRTGNHGNRTDNYDNKTDNHGNRAGYHGNTTIMTTEDDAPCIDAQCDDIEDELSISNLFNAAASTSAALSTSLSPQLISTAAEYIDLSVVKEEPTAMVTPDAGDTSRSGDSYGGGGGSGEPVSVAMDTAMELGGVNINPRVSVARLPGEMVRGLEEHAHRQQPQQPVTDKAKPSTAPAGAGPAATVGELLKQAALGPGFVNWKERLLHYIAQTPAAKLQKTVRIVKCGEVDYLGIYTEVMRNVLNVMNLRQILKDLPGAICARWYMNLHEDKIDIGRRKSGNSEAKQRQCVGIPISCVPELTYEQIEKLTRTAYKDRMIREGLMREEDVVSNLYSEKLFSTSHNPNYPDCS